MLRIEAPHNIRSLCWLDDQLIDWASGGQILRLDGTIGDPNVIYGYRFDAAVMSPCGEFAVIYEKLGTKGLVLNKGRVVREINRSFYHANVYEYPIAIFETQDGQTALVHCPEQYCRLEIEDIRTGETLAKSDMREPGDFFHSRLRTCPDGNWLLSAGWIWHPWNDVAVYDINASLRDGAALDKSLPLPSFDYEVVSAELISRDRMLITTSNETLDDDPNEGNVGPRSLAVVDLSTRTIESCVQAQEPVGMLMPLDEELAIGFYGFPKLFSLKTGEVLKRWEEINSGNQTSSVIWNEIHAPPIAIDKEKRRFAVAENKFVTVVNVDS